MLWTFQSGHGTVRVLSLTVVSAPVGARVQVQCSGRGCPHTYTRVVRAKKGCRSEHCPATGTVQIDGPFSGRQIAFGGRVVVSVVKSRWIGKVFTFKVSAEIQPKIACLAPNANKPGVGC
jgi:hypothetical protein